MKRENKWLRKVKLCMLQKERFRWEKLQGMKLKDRSRKRKERNSEIHDNNTPSTNKSSAERELEKHKENKRGFISVPFKLPRST